MTSANEAKLDWGFRLPAARLNFESGVHGRAVKLQSTLLPRLVILTGDPDGSAEVAVDGVSGRGDDLRSRFFFGVGDFDSERLLRIGDLETFVFDGIRSGDPGARMSAFHERHATRRVRHGAELGIGYHISEFVVFDHFYTIPQSLEKKLKSRREALTRRGEWR